MDRMAEQSKPSKYCMDCGYCLDHLESHQCPECGRAFDPADHATFSNIAKRSLWPRWETVFALVMVAMIYMLSWDWETKSYFYYGGRARITWHNSYSPHGDQLAYLLWFTPAICLAPLFLYSGLRVKPRNAATIFLSILSLILYFTCDGTHLWYGRILQLIKVSYREESYWEAVEKLLQIVY